METIQLLLPPTIKDSNHSIAIILKQNTIKNFVRYKNRWIHPKIRTTSREKIKKFQYKWYQKLKLKIAQNYIQGNFIHSDYFNFYFCYFNTRNSIDFFVNYCLRNRFQRICVSITSEEKN